MSHKIPMPLFSVRHTKSDSNVYMEQIGTTTLNDSGNILEDCQLWSKAANGYIPKLASLVCRVDYTLIPLYLFTSDVYTLYSNSEATNEYFKNKLVVHSDKRVGLLFKVDDSTYHMTYFDIPSGQIKCHVISFQVWSMISNIMTSDSSQFVEFKETEKQTKDKHEVFNRVLENKKKRVQSSSPPLTTISSTSPPLLSTQLILTNNEQIALAVNKLILSGLRLRGLSLKNSNISANEKVAIKEIYQITRKSTLFALRKFNYTFNDNSKNYSIKFTDVQTVVEQLLEAFIDV